MGMPADNQLKGTPEEQLVELSGRVCYDSLGKGRNSEEYHKHIIEVGHGSVWEHANLTFEFKSIHKYISLDLLRFFINKPGLWVSSTDPGSFRVTMNFRSIREWNTWSCWLSEDLGKILQIYMRQ